MSNKIIQRILIDGKNWNEIINLPCVQALDKGDERIKMNTPCVILYDSYLTILQMNGHNFGMEWWV